MRSRRSSGYRIFPAGAVLERLAADNFLDLKICNDLLYRFNPATPALEAAANRSAEFYLAERVSVIELVMTGKLEREKRG